MSRVPWKGKGKGSRKVWHVQRKADGLCEQKEDSGATCFGNKSIYGSVEDESGSQPTLHVKEFHSALLEPLKPLLCVLEG